MSDPNEIFDLYDAGEYRVVGQSTRGKCHGNPLLVHAVARIHVFDRQGNILLQLRSPNKDVQPGRWDTAVGGHLMPGEDAETAARREMGEELGVVPSHLTFLHRFLWHTPIETEWVSTFCAVHEGPFVPDPYEIAGLRFWSRQTILDQVGTGIFTPAFEDEFAKLPPNAGRG